LLATRSERAGPPPCGTPRAPLGAPEVMGRVPGTSPRSPDIPIPAEPPSEKSPTLPRSTVFMRMWVGPYPPPFFPPPPRILLRRRPCTRNPPTQWPRPAAPGAPGVPPACPPLGAPLSLVGEGGAGSLVGEAVPLLVAIRGPSGPSWQWWGGGSGPEEASSFRAAARLGSSACNGAQPGERSSTNRQPCSECSVLLVVVYSVVILRQATGAQARGNVRLRSSAWTQAIKRQCVTLEEEHRRQGSPMQPDNYHELCSQGPGVAKEKTA